MLSQLPMTEGLRQETFNEDSNDGAVVLVWLAATFLFGILIGMRIVRRPEPGADTPRRVPQCKIEKEISLQVPMPKRFPRRTIATQSQCTYTRCATQPKFRPLPDRSHGVFFESELFRANFPLRKGHVVEPDDDEELFQKYYFMEGGPGKKNH